MIHVFTSAIGVAHLPCSYGQLVEKQADASELLIMGGLKEGSTLLRVRYDDLRLFGRIIGLVKTMNINVESSEDAMVMPDTQLELSVLHFFRKLRHELFLNPTVRKLGSEVLDKAMREQEAASAPSGFETLDNLVRKYNTNTIV